MPPPAYTSRRRLLLQIVMVLIFAATMAMAAAVRHQRQGTSGVTLDKPMPLGDLRVMVPSTWTSSDKLDIFPFVRSVQSAEPIDASGRRAVRVLRVTLQKSDPGVSAEQFLRGAKRLSDGAAKPITVAGQPGVQLSERVLTGTGTEGASAVHLYACAILSNDRAVIVDLLVVGRDPDSREQALLRDVAASIRPASQK